MKHKKQTKNKASPRLLIGPRATTGRPLSWTRKHQTVICLNGPEIELSPQICWCK